MSRIMHMKMSEIQSNDDTETVQVDCMVKIMETDKPCFVVTVNPVVTLKNGLGVYKLPAVLNSEAIADAQQYLADNYEYPINGYTKVYIRGGFSTAL